MISTRVLFCLVVATLAVSAVADQSPAEFYISKWREFERLWNSHAPRAEMESFHRMLWHKDVYQENPVGSPGVSGVEDVISSYLDGFAAVDHFTFSILDTQTTADPNQFTMEAVYSLVLKDGCRSNLHVLSHVTMQDGLIIRNMAYWDINGYLKCVAPQPHVVTDEEVRRMNTEFTDLWNEKGVGPELEALMRRHYHADIVQENPVGTPAIEGIDNMIKSMEQWGGVSNLAYTYVGTVETGVPNTFVHKLVCTLTMGDTCTVSMPVTTFNTFQDGLVISSRNVWDMAALAPCMPSGEKDEL